MSLDYKFSGVYSFFIANSVIGSLSHLFKREDPAFLSLGNVEVFSSLCIAPIFFYHYYKQHQHNNQAIRVISQQSEEEQDLEDGVGFSHNVSPDSSCREVIPGALVGLISSVAFGVLYIVGYDQLNGSSHNLGLF